MGGTLGACERAAVESSGASPPRRPRADGLTHPADPSRTNLAATLGLLFVVAAFQLACRRCSSESRSARSSNIYTAPTPCAALPSTTAHPQHITHRG